MMRKTLFLITALACGLCLSDASLLAQHGGGGHGGGMGGGAGMGGEMRSGMGGGMSSRANSPGHMGNGMGMMQSGASLGKQSPSETLPKSPHLSSKLQSLLPAGTNLKSAATGFKNLGQFIAAVHVSHNLGIPFEDLKQRIVSGDSLGKAIQAFKPNVNSKHEAKKAKDQSKQDLNQAASRFPSAS
jgi:hypothetical protein